VPPSENERPQHEYFIAQSDGFEDTNFRRVGDFASVLPENAPLIEKTNPDKLNSVVEMIMNLQPKANASQPAKTSVKQPRELSAAQHIRRARSSGDEAAVSESRAFAPKGNPPMAGLPPSERAYSYAPPRNIPLVKKLPPADYTYVKNGVYHHVHDFRKTKPKYPRTKVNYQEHASDGPGYVQGHVYEEADSEVAASGKGGWLKFDFSEAIMTTLGLPHPGRSLVPTIGKCSKIYIFQVILRFFQKILVGF
jgi:hypothetical protein